MVAMTPSARPRPGAGSNTTMTELLRSVVTLALVTTLALAVLALPAQARVHRVTVRLADGTLKTAPVDLKRGTSLSSIRLAGPVVAIDGKPVEQPLPGKGQKDQVPATPGPKKKGAGFQGGGKAKGNQPHDRERAVDGRGRSSRRRSSSDRRRGPRPQPARERSHPKSSSGPRKNLAPGNLSPPSSNGFNTLPGPASPDPSLDRFRVPPFLLPIYRAAADRYKVPWEVLAAVNEIETDFGRNVAVSSAGAVGWMQFMPATWRDYGLDANGDGHEDPLNPLDAIFSAARYLKASGAEHDLRGAIFAYNHADWYVQSVLLRARVIGGAPEALVGSLSGLAEGRFPIQGEARYTGRTDRDRPAIDIATREGAAVVAADGSVVKQLGRSPDLGRFAVLEDEDGNRYTYAGLDPKEQDGQPAAGRQVAAAPQPGAFALFLGVGRREPADRLGPFSVLFPQRSPVRSASSSIGAADSLAGVAPDRRLRRGLRLAAGSMLGRAGKRLRFAIRPAGGRGPIDPKPILDGWRLLAQAGSKGELNDEEPVGRSNLLRLPTRVLERRVLEDERIEFYACGRRDVRAHRIDQRVLVALSQLAEAGLHPTVSSLQCGHGLYTASGNVSEHSAGSAVDISHLNGIPVLGHQARGGITEQGVRQLLKLRGAMAPHQVISLLDLGGQSFAMADHADHIHLGFRPESPPVKDSRLPRLDVPGWSELVPRLGEIESPTVARGPSRFALRAER